MKKSLFLLLTIGMMVAAAATAAAQNTDSTIPFVDEEGYEIEYFYHDIGDMVANADTLETGWKANSITKRFPCSGPDEYAILILIPGKEYTKTIKPSSDYPKGKIKIKAVCTQPDEEGEILTLRLLTNKGWLKCKYKPYSRELIDLDAYIAHIQHLLEVSDSQRLR